MIIKISDNFAKMLLSAHKIAIGLRHRVVTPEHIFSALAEQDEFRAAFSDMGIDIEDITVTLLDHLTSLDSVPEDDDEEFQPQMSVQFQELLAHSALGALSAEASILTVPHIVSTFIILKESESYLRTILNTFMGTKITFKDFVRVVTEKYQDSEKKFREGWAVEIRYMNSGNGAIVRVISGSKEDVEAAEAADLVNGENQKHIDPQNNPFMRLLGSLSEAIANRQAAAANGGSQKTASTGKEPWRQLVTCLNDTYKNHNPLIGREPEIERTIQVLCRKDKNNPLHVGDPGVGKTSLIYGLTERIVKGDVPERLVGAKVYLMDVATLIAGAQFRGEFESRVQMIVEGVKAEASNNIIYIDEIHNIIGTGGGGGEHGLDGSGLLKPYLEDGNIRFIGSTTYEELNRYLMKSAGFMRRFQIIDVNEPSISEAQEILKRLQPEFESFHKIKYGSGVVDYAVEASAKHISDRCLPDKAIDLIDEAGAALEISKTVKKKTVTKKMINDVLQKTCKIHAEALKDDTNVQLRDLMGNMTSKVFGQDEAVRNVVESVQMSKAGLLDDNKPLASLLFVGPTGVGKTEVAKTLAEELGIELVRFDMSEYTEKHAVAKLIGSPAGYVGYDDGGLLTDAIKKTPNCVLLLDEIEKAHQDIYNILLQVMDYAKLTDNKGRKADFHNVIIIMTSNAGAQYAGQASIGFNSNVTRGEAMLKQVKKTFKPEFINRLTGTVVFRDMDKDMAERILNKKLGELQKKLDAKNVKMKLSDEAFEFILKEGFVPEYGAREMDRVIAQRLKPLLMREILFGSLIHGGEVEAIVENEEVKLKNSKEE